MNNNNQPIQSARPRLNFVEIRKCLAFAWKTDRRMCLATGVLSLGYLLQTLMPIILAGIVSSTITGQMWLAVVFAVVWLLANTGNWLIIAVGVMYDSRFREKLRFAAQWRVMKALLSPATIEHYRDVRLAKLRERFAECGDLAGRTWSAFFDLANSLIFPIGMTMVALWLTPMAWILLPCCIPGLLVVSKQASLERASLEESAPAGKQIEEVMSWLASESNASHARHIGAVTWLRAGFAGEVTRWAKIRQRRAIQTELLAMAAHLFYILGAAGLLAWTLIIDTPNMVTASTVSGLLVVIVMLYGSVFGVQEMYVDAAGVATAISDITQIEEIASQAIKVSAQVGTRGSIILDQAGYTYPGAKQPALYPMSLMIPAGIKVAIVGSNGAGKTTLVDLLSGVYRPTTGQVKVGEGKALLDEVATGAFQNGLHIAHSLRIEVAAGKGENSVTDTEVTAAIDRSGASSFAQELDRDLLLQPVSGGQRQKLSAARSNLDEHAWLGLFDEPSSALDAHAERELFQNIFGWGYTPPVSNKNSSIAPTTIIVSHNLAVGALAQMVIHLEDGKLVAYGSHAQILETDPSYAQAYNAQLAAYRD